MGACLTLEFVADLLNQEDLGRRAVRHALCSNLLIDGPHHVLDGLRLERRPRLHQTLADQLRALDCKLLAGVAIKDGESCGCAFSGQKRARGVLALFGLAICLREELVRLSRCRKALMHFFSSL